MSLIQMLQQMGILALMSLLVGVTPALMGAAYALWPTEAKLALMRPVSLAAIFGALAGFVGGVINGIHFAAVNENSLTSITAMVGFAEALVPLFVAFGSLTIAWLMVVVGMRRMG